VGSFVSGLTGKKTNVEFKKTDVEPDLPESCQPEIPSGWQFDDATGEWTKTTECNCRFEEMKREANLL